MKLQTLAEHMAPLLPCLRCPRCGAPLTLFENRSLVCVQRHCFDLSTKGYINLAPDHNQSTEKYDAELFQSRSRIFADGFYAHVAQALRALMQRHLGTVRRASNNANEALPVLFSEERIDASSRFNLPLIVDVGCGEGYYARALAESLLSPAIIGVDLSRDAILAAARQSPSLLWLVGDLTHLPFADHSVDALVDVLTPADYREFARILKPNGLLLKVIPADDYLIEIRHAVADQLRNSDFSNARVIEHLQAHADVAERIAMRRTLPVTPEQAQAFLRMTPMTFGLTDTQRESIRFSEITVAMELLVCHLH